MQEKRSILLQEKYLKDLKELEPNFKKNQHNELIFCLFFLLTKKKKKKCLGCTKLRNCSKTKTTNLKKKLKKIVYAHQELCQYKF